jgi:hypothetical protein
MKQMTFYPSDREDTEFTAWNYAPTCLEDLDSPNMFARRGFRTPSRTGMPDDSFARIPLGQLSVKFGGVSYSNIYIGSNGYVTFGSGDNRYDNAVSAHYDTPRISVGFMVRTTRPAGFCYVHYSLCSSSHQRVVELAPTSRGRRPGQQLVLCTLRFRAHQTDGLI